MRQSPLGIPESDSEPSPDVETAVHKEQQWAVSGKSADALLYTKLSIFELNKLSSLRFFNFFLFQLAQVLRLDCVMLVCQEVEVPMAQIAQDVQDSSVSLSAACPFPSKH